MKSILVLCTGNSCRSQIAEAYLRYFSEGRALVYSAGIEAHGLNPNAISTMKDDGFDITLQTSDTLHKYIDQRFDHVITVCDHAAEVCPVFMNAGKKHHYNFPDPAKFKGNDVETKAEFAKVRNMIKSYCSLFVKFYV